MFQSKVILTVLPAIDNPSRISTGSLNFITANLPVFSGFQEMTL